MQRSSRTVQRTARTACWCALVVRSCKQNYLLEQAKVKRFKVRAPASPSTTGSFIVLALLHHLISVIILSCEVPTSGSVFKESVKVCAPKSPSFSDDSVLDFSAFYVFPHGSSAQPTIREAMLNLPVFVSLESRLHTLTVLSNVGANLGKAYHLFAQNCEHFASLYFTGQAESESVQVVGAWSR